MADYKSVAWNRIRRWQDRAARILDTKIARRADLATLGTTFQILGRVGEPPSTILRNRPDEEEIESAAARVRPLVLEQDGLTYQQVIKALKSLTQNASKDTKDAIEACRVKWKEVVEGKYWAIQGGKTKDGSDWSPWMWDREVARLWLYADLVHADKDAQEKLRYISRDDRTMAGLLWVKDMVLLVRATQQLIVDLEEAGELEKAAA